MEFIEEVTEKADEIQTRVLAEILSRNSNVEYLKRHGLDGHTDREAFKKIVPVISYEDMQPDIKRIANGDSSPILCCEPISEFLTRFEFCFFFFSCCVNLITLFHMWVISLLCFLQDYVFSPFFFLPT